MEKISKQVETSQGETSQELEPHMRRPDGGDSLEQFRKDYWPKYREKVRQEEGRELPEVYGSDVPRHEPKPEKSDVGSLPLEKWKKDHEKVFPEDKKIEHPHNKKIA